MAPLPQPQPPLDSESDESLNCTWQADPVSLRASSSTATTASNPNKNEAGDDDDEASCLVREIVVLRSHGLDHEQQLEKERVARASCAAIADTPPTTTFTGIAPQPFLTPQESRSSLVYPLGRLCEADIISSDFRPHLEQQQQDLKDSQSCLLEKLTLQTGHVNVRDYQADSMKEKSDRFQKNEAREKTILLQTAVTAPPEPYKYMHKSDPKNDSSDQAQVIASDSRSSTSDHDSSKNMRVKADKIDSDDVHHGKTDAVKEDKDRATTNNPSWRNWQDQENGCAPSSAVGATRNGVVDASWIGREVIPPPPLLAVQPPLSNMARPGAYTAAPGTGLVRNRTLSFALVGFGGLEDESVLEDQQNRRSTTTTTTSTHHHQEDTGNLVTANPVSEDDLLDPENMPRAQPMNPREPERGPDHQATARKPMIVRTVWFCLGLVVVVTASVLVTILVLRSDVSAFQTTTNEETANDTPKTNDPTNTTGMDGTPASTSRFNSTHWSEEDRLLEEILSGVPSFIADHTRRQVKEDGTSLTDPSPQRKAFQWVVQDPNVSFYPMWRIRQRFILAILYYTTHGENWLRSDGWLEYNTDECEWLHTSERFHYGNLVFDNHPPCGANYSRGSNNTTNDNSGDGGIYKNLWLEGIGMNGTLPMELFAMTSLEIVSLAAIAYDVIFNEETGLQQESFGSAPHGLSGTLSTEIGLLTNLNYLLLNENKLSSSIPSEIGLLTNLKGLDLKFNYRITGELPKEIGQLTSLEVLDLVDLNLFGPAFPGELLLLTDMKYLHLKGNSFTGSIPSGVQQFTSLINLAVDDNFLTGTLPTELGRLSTMRQFYVGNNQIIGPIPSQLGECTSLLILDIHQNMIEGTVPTEVARLPEMGFFQINSNRLTGSIPTQIGLQKNVYWLDFSNNYFSGAFPSEEFINDYTYLHLLFLNNNPQLTGTVPENLMTDSFAYRLKLQNTGISGTIPAHLCRLEDRLEFNCQMDRQICGCDRVTAHVLPDPPQAASKLASTVVEKGFECS